MWEHGHTITTMPWLWVLRAVVALVCLVCKGHSLCTNFKPEAECIAKAAVGECYLDTFLPCQCTKACDFGPSCPGSIGDGDCMCFYVSNQCDDSSVQSLCPETCLRRTSTVVCDPLPVVPNASPSIPSPLYGDKVTYTCDLGYNQTGGETGFRACATGGAWVVSATTGLPPVCEGVSCASPPEIPGCEPSATSGSYPDVITYGCVPGTVRLYGGTARHSCNASGAWIADISDTIPVCVSETNHYKTSVSEIDTGAAPILTTRSARSGLECARFCSLSPQCEGYTYAKTTRVCSHNVGPYLPIVTEMKKVYEQP